MSKIIQVKDLLIGNLKGIIIEVRITDIITSYNKDYPSVYYLEDESGKIEAKCFDSQKNSMLKKILQAIKPNTYLRFAKMWKCIFYYNHKEIDLGIYFTISKIKKKELIIQNPE